MTNMNGLSQKILDGTYSQKLDIEMEDSNISMIDEGQSQTGMRYLSQDLNSKRMVESQKSIFGKDCSRRL